MSTSADVQSIAPTLSLAIRATFVRQVSLDKDKYLAAVRGFSLNSAIPNMNSNVWFDSFPIPTRPTLSRTHAFVHQAYHYRVDPYEPNRVWFTIRNSGTHTGALKFAGKTFEGTVGT